MSHSTHILTNTDYIVQVNYTIHIPIPHIPNIPFPSLLLPINSPYNTLDHIIDNSQHHSNIIDNVNQYKLNIVHLLSKMYHYNMLNIYLIDYKINIDWFGKVNNMILFMITIS